jgi:Tol biopolymer transport system component
LHYQREASMPPLKTNPIFRNLFTSLLVLLLVACEARPVTTPTALLPAETETARPVATVEGRATMEVTAVPTETATVVPTVLPTAEEMAAPVDGRLVLDNFEDIFMANGDGSGLVQLTDEPGPEFDGMLSPDGTKIVYRDSTRGINMNDEIFVMNVDGSGKRNLSNDPADDWGPAWSPDGTQIAFSSTRGGSLPQLFVMDGDGGNVRQLTEREGEYPSWSPDGSQLVFMSQEPAGANNYEIYVINSDGSGARRLTDSPGSDGWPVWSPDGRLIAFSSERADCRYSTVEDCLESDEEDALRTIWVMTADGTNQRRLTDVYGQFVTWSPDGRWVAFGSYGGLHLVAVEGGQVVRRPVEGLLDSGLLHWSE